MLAKKLVLLQNLSLFTAALVMSAVAAQAQDANYNPAAYTPPDTEEVIVTAPDIRMERNPAAGLPGKATLSRTVSYSDLDLGTVGGARTLRARVRETARDICDTLRDAYPLRQQPGTSCYRDALKDAMPRADAAIRDARW
ncbi:MAG: UrcA family protein [Alphaproteobacteria bacterium]|nr:UrcA family protein [Alphaproteobacteria bacterium]MBL6936832.1 UrcA family protein [Alphaproteobacteria bacterium]MBL7097601.1 UrcA family protein [Alphaproteobacteria bacterium]